MSTTILTDGIRRFQDPGNDEDTALLRSEAEDWIFSDDRTSMFAFVRICAVLGIDTAELRAELVLRRARPDDPICALGAA